MVGDTLLIKRKHERIARELIAKVKMQGTNKTTVTIGGESGSGKSEIAHVMRNELQNEGFKAKILHLDNYYKTSPGSRNDHRRKHGMLAVGLHEINWELLEANIDAFYKETIEVLPFIDLYTNQEDKLITNFLDIDVLLIEGLYACNYAADIRVYIDIPFTKNIRAQLHREKEIVNLFRIKILEKESKEALKTRPASDYLITPGFSLVNNESRNSRLHMKNQTGFQTFITKWQVFLSSHKTLTVNQ